MTHETLTLPGHTRGSAGSVGLAIVLGVLAVAACAIGGFLLRDKAAPGLVFGGAGLAAIGLFLILAILAGLLKFGRRQQDRVLLDGFADALGEACVVTDSRGRPVYANAAYLKMASEAGLGRLVGLENIYAGYPDAADHIYRLAQAAREGKPGTDEFRLAAGSAAAGAKPNSPTWIRISVAPLAETGHTLWRQSDVSNARARQEQAFGQLQSIITYLDHAPAGFFSANSEGAVGYINATLAGWLGVDLAQTASGTLKLADFVPEQGLALLNGIAPTPGAARTESFDMELATKDGKALPVRIIHRVDFDEAGQLQPARSLVLRPASAEDAATSSGADLRLARFFNHAPVGIAEIDGQGIVRNVNLAFIAISSKAQRGGNITAIVEEAQRGTLQAAIDAAREREGTPHLADVSVGGEAQKSVQIVVSKLIGGDGFVVYALDSTEKKTLEAQLAQSHKMQAIGQLAGGMAHDFNNVLTAIIGFSDLLLSKHRASDPAFGDIMNIKQNANRAANLVRQLLAFSRRQTLQPKVLQLTDVLSDLGNLLGRLLGEKIELEMVHGRDLWLVLADLNQFEQVIINLAVNARDAMPKGGTLTIRTANVAEDESRGINPGVMAAGEYVMAEVIDTGTGMTPDVLEKIYEPFFSTKEVGKGTGLGLSTVYGIVKQTGGFIFCDSEVGKGTTFRVYLPRHIAKVTAPEIKDEKKENKRSDLTGTGRILLVEDEDAVRAFASRALTSRGYTVIEASSGERALEAVEEEEGKFDLVISDVVMPEMDGPTLLKELRKQGLKAKFILMSGYAEDAFQKNPDNPNDFAFLAKPFSLKQLVETAKQVMES